MVIIAVNGSAYFVETNAFIVWREIAATVFITILVIAARIYTRAKPV